MLPTLMIVFIFIMIGWGVISSTAPKTDHKRHRRKGDGGEFADFGDSIGGCDGGGGGGD